AVTAVCGECGPPQWPVGQMNGPAAIVHAGGAVLEVHSLLMGEKLILEFLKGTFRGAHEALVVERDQHDEASESVEEPTKAFGDQVARVLDPSMDALSSEHVGITVHLPMGDAVVQTVCEELPAVPVFPVLGKCGLAEDDRDVEDLPEEAVKLEAVKVEAKTVKLLNASAGKTEKIVKVPMAKYVENIVHVPTGVTQEAEEGVSCSCTASSAETSAAGASESAAAGSEQNENVHEYEKEVMNELDDMMKVVGLSGGEEPSARGPRSWEATVAANQLAHARAAAAAACRRAQWRLEHDELEDAAVFGTAVLAAPRVAIPQCETMVEAEVLTGLAEDESQGGDVIYADAPGGLCDQIVQACGPFEPGSEEHGAALARVLEGFGLTIDDFRSMLTAPVGTKRKNNKRRGQMTWG
ncbi:unnamed protein product, partial [Prorocentrum cordatum]